MEAFAIIVGIVDILPNLCAADIYEGRIGNGNAFWDVFQLTARPGIDNHLVMCQYLLVFVPVGKTLPVVGSNDEDEFAFRIVLTQVLQRIDHI